MRTVAVILAAGQGTRFGGDKTGLSVRGKPLWRYSFDTFQGHPSIDAVGILASPDNIEAIRSQAEGAHFVELGGATRTDSSRRAVELADSEWILIHDAARPLVSHELISRVLESLENNQAVAPALPVTDTIKQRDGDVYRTLDRSQLHAMQTPQAAHRSVLKKAYSESKQEFTDEMALLESTGIQPHFVAGEARNFKVTTQDDLARLAGYFSAPETRTGLGYDIHPFSTDPDRKMVLGGVEFEGPALDGHSDADVILHAVVDALLGAVSLGDIGVHFPNSDERWRGAPSTHFLRYAADLLAEHGWQVVNVDISVVAEFPKIMKQAQAIREAIGGGLGVASDRIGIKATTNERLGSIGRGEGIAAFAVATVRQRI